MVRSLLVGLCVLVASGCASVKPVLLADPVKRVTWMGETDLDMLKQVQQDIADAKAQGAYQLNVTLLSPGGPVFAAFEIAEVMQKAEASGLQIEVHAQTLCASGCTFVLGAGSKGHRYMNQESLFLVHPPQQQASMMEPPSCVQWPDENSQTVDDKANRQVLMIMAEYYSKFTGRPLAETKKWVTCGNEQVGEGDLAVKLGFADLVD